MAERLIEYLAHRHGDGIVKSNNTAKAADANNISSTETMPIRQPHFLRNPLIRQVRRRPAQLNLSKNIPTSGALPTPASSKPLSAMSVREKLFKGISMDINRLQANPASFDRIFPPKPAGSAPRSKMKRAQETRDTLNKQLHAHETPDIADEEEEARQFEKNMRSARKYSWRLQVALQLSTCDQLPFEKLADVSLFSQRMRRARAKKTTRTPSSLSREL